MIKTEVYLNKIKNAVENYDSYKKNKYLNKIMNGGDIFKGKYENNTYTGQINGKDKITVRKGKWTDVKLYNEIYYLNPKKGYFGTWTDDDSGNVFTGTWIGIFKKDNSVNKDVYEGEWNNLDNMVIKYIPEDPILINEMNERVKIIVKDSTKTELNNNIFNTLTLSLEKYNTGLDIKSKLSLLDKDKFKNMALSVNKFDENIIIREALNLFILSNNIFKEFLVIMKLFDIYKSSNKHNIYEKCIENGENDLKNILNILKHKKTNDKYNIYLNQSYKYSNVDKLILTGYYKNKASKEIQYIYVYFKKKSETETDVYIINTDKDAIIIKNKLDANKYDIVTYYLNVDEIKINILIKLCAFNNFTINSENEDKDHPMYLLKYGHLWIYQEGFKPGTIFPYSYSGTFLGNYKENKLSNTFFYYCIGKIFNTKYDEPLKIHASEIIHLHNYSNYSINYYFIKYFIFTDNFDDLNDFNNYVIKTNIKNYTDILYFDNKNYIITRENIEDNKIFYNNLQIIFKDYNFENKYTFLKLYENIVKNNKNYYIIEEPDIKPVVDILDDGNELLLTFLNSNYNSIENLKVEILKYLKNRYIASIEKDNYKIFVYNLFMDKMIDLIYKFLLNAEKQNMEITEINQDEIINIITEIKLINNRDKNLIKLIHMYFILEKFPVDIDCKQKNMMWDYIVRDDDSHYLYFERIIYAVASLQIQLKDYIINYIDFYNSLLTKITYMTIDKMYFICLLFFNIADIENGIRETFDEAASNNKRIEYFKDYSVMMNNTNILGMFYTIINTMVNNNKINNSYIDDFINNFIDKPSFLINYKIFDIGNFNDCLNYNKNFLKNKEKFCYDVKRASPLENNNVFNNCIYYTEDNFINLSLTNIINKLKIEDFKRLSKIKFRDILLCYIYLFNNALYIELCDDNNDNIIFNLISNICIQNKEEIFKTDNIYNTLIYNIIINSEKDIVMHIFNIFKKTKNIIDLEKNSSSNYILLEEKFHDIKFFTSNGELFYNKGTQYIKVEYIIDKFYVEYPKYIRIIKNDSGKKEDIENLYMVKKNISTDILQNKLINSSIYYINLENDKKDILYYDLLDYDNEYFYIENNLTYFKNKINTYRVIFNTDDATLSMWTLFMLNGFILEDIETDVKYILIFINTDGKKLNKEIIFDKEIKKYHILKLHFTNLYVMTNDYNDLSALMISLIVSKNNMCQYLIHHHFKNLYLENKNNDKYIYNNYIGEILNNNNVPYSTIIKKSIGITLPVDTEIDKYLEIDKYINNNVEFNLKEIKNTNEYIVCTKIIEEISEYCKEKPIIPDIYNIEEKINIDEFIKRYKYKCMNTSKKFNEINLESTKKNNYFINLLYVNKKKNKANKKNIIPGKLLNIVNLYKSNYLFFYKMLVNKFLNEIKRNFNNIVKKEGDINTSEILSIIDKLNSEIIYNFDKPRKIQDIVCELQDEIILKQIQYEYIEKIYTDNSSGNYNTIYQVLMGIGKTSVMTPILILNYYFNTLERKNVYIVLPKHLVNESYNKMIKYSNVFTNYNVNKINITDNNSLNILSDYDYKYYIYQNFDKINNVDFYNTVIHNSLFILDEIDTLINPLKSELNIPVLENYTQHIEYENLVEIYIQKIIYKKDPVLDSSEKSIIINNKLLYIDKFIENNIYDKNFGFGNLNYNNITTLLNDKNRFIAIPYSANHSPVDGSEYTDFELSLSLTICSYKESNFRPDDIELIFLNMMNTERDLFEIIFYYITTFIDFDNMRKLYDEDKEAFKNNCKLIATKINEDSNVLNILEQYLKNIIFYNFLKISTEQFTISTIDMVGKKFMNNRIAFSGTVSFYEPQKIIVNKLFDYSKIINDKIKTSIDGQYNLIDPDKYSNGAVLIAFNGDLTKKYDILKPEIYIYSDDMTKQQHLENDLLNKIIENIDSLNALIDTAGIFLIQKTIDIIGAIYIKTNKIYYF